MKVFFLSDDRNTVAFAMMAAGFSWEEGINGVSCLFMKGCLPFVLEGLYPLPSIGALADVRKSNRDGVIVGEKGTLEFFGPYAEKLHDLVSKNSQC